MAKRKRRTCRGNNFIECKRIGVSSNMNYQCNVCKEIQSHTDIVKRFSNSTILLNIWNTSKRAGSLQTFVGLEDLQSYLDMMLKSRGYGFIEKKRLQVSHLIAVKGNSRLGMTNKHNLVLLLESMNKQLSNKEVFAHGVLNKHYINIDDLDHRWLVGSQSKKEFIQLLENYIGFDELYEWAERNNIKASKRSKKPFEYSSGASLFDVMIKQLVGYHSWLDSLEIIKFEDALSRYKVAFIKEYKIEDDIESVLFWNHQEDDAIGLLLQEALYRGCDSLLIQARQVIELAHSKLKD